jgi:prepilin-type N-terminal cleavage/methylation domain-containing protein
MTPSESGFTLVEIAIVLLVVAVLLGYTVALFPKQQELKKYAGKRSPALSCNPKYSGGRRRWWCG